MGPVWADSKMIDCFHMATKSILKGELYSIGAWRWWHFLLVRWASHQEKPVIFNILQQETKQPKKQPQDYNKTNTNN